MGYNALAIGERLPQVRQPRVDPIPRLQAGLRTSEDVTDGHEITRDPGQVDCDTLPGRR